jgi:RNA polymerase sigma-70 factor (ECF subfamily)
MAGDSTAPPDRFLDRLEAAKGILYKIARAWSRDPHERADLLQEMAFQLWRSFERYDEGMPFSTWAYRISLNVAISFRRRESRRRNEVPLEQFGLDVAAADRALADESPDVIHLLDRVAALDELNRALVLLHLDGLRHAEIGATLGISEGNVATRLGRIKERLRREMDPSGTGR